MKHNTGIIIFAMLAATGIATLLRPLPLHGAQLCAMRGLQAVFVLFAANAVYYLWHRKKWARKSKATAPSPLPPSIATPTFPPLSTPADVLWLFLRQRIFPGRIPIISSTSLLFCACIVTFTVFTGRWGALALFAALGLVHAALRFAPYIRFWQQRDFYNNLQTVISAQGVQVVHPLPGETRNIISDTAETIDNITFTVEAFSWKQIWKADIAGTDACFTHQNKELHTHLTPQTLPVVSRFIGRYFTTEAVASPHVPACIPDWKATVEALKNSKMPSCTLTINPSITALASDTYMGGAPIVPEGWEWPHQDGRPLTFLFQTQLADLSGEMAKNCGLPREGRLYCFFNMASHDYTGEGNNGALRVIYMPHLNYPHHTAPQPAGLDRRLWLQHLPLKAAAHTSMPLYATLRRTREDMRQLSLGTYWAAHMATDSNLDMLPIATRHTIGTLGGHPFCGTSSGFDVPFNTDGMTLLAQFYIEKNSFELASVAGDFYDRNLDLPFMLYIFIPTEDLPRLDFTRVRYHVGVLGLF